MNPVTSRLSMRTAGESHGVGIVAILEGVPRGLLLDVAAVDAELKRRQGGAGRGGRQRMEDDRVEILGGLRRGRTIGSPLCMLVRNRDASIDLLPEPTRPRPGHADLAGCYHWLDRDLRSTIERASARETCARVATGAVAAQILGLTGAVVFGFVRRVHSVVLPEDLPTVRVAADIMPLRAQRDASELYTLDEAVDAAMLGRVREAGIRKDTVGGVVEVHAAGLVPGLGSCVQWSERLDSRLGAALLSIPAIKGVEIGAGFAAASRFGGEVHDAILPAEAGGELPARGSNRAGGLEGGMTNGQPVVVRAAMKPIATLQEPLSSVDLTTGAAAAAGYERSDLCAVSAASVVAEAMVALVLADALLYRIGGESIGEFLARYAAHLALLARIPGSAAPEKSRSSP